MKTELAYTLNGCVWVPDIEVKVDNHEYVYEPLRGYSMIMAVLNIHDRCIGWINARTLGYEDVKTYMRANNIVYTSLD